MKLFVLLTGISNVLFGITLQVPLGVAEGVLRISGFAVLTYYDFFGG